MGLPESPFAAVLEGHSSISLHPDHATLQPPQGTAAWVQNQHAHYLDEETVALGREGLPHDCAHGKCSQNVCTQGLPSGAHQGLCRSLTALPSWFFLPGGSLPTCHPSLCPIPSLLRPGASHRAPLLPRGPSWERQLHFPLWKRF